MHPDEGRGITTGVPLFGTLVVFLPTLLFLAGAVIHGTAIQDKSGWNYG